MVCRFYVEYDFIYFITLELFYIYDVLCDFRFCYFTLDLFVLGFIIFFGCCGGP